MTPRVVVGGLGPAGPDLLTQAVHDAIDAAPAVFLRTARHPAAAGVQAVSFDSLYEGAASIDEVYAAIVEALVEAAAEHGHVLYLVPGSPAVAERTVALLRVDERVTIEVLPGMSFLDLAWDRLGVDPVAEGVRVVDGRRFVVEAAGERGPLLVAQCDTKQVLSDVKLAVDDGGVDGGGDGDGDGSRVVLLHHLGLPDEQVVEVAWSELDRTLEPDHLTSVYVPVLGAPVASEVMRFYELVRTLRERCPWDREQTHASLTRHLVEETYETVEAIESGDPAHLEEELGDLLFQVFFHSVLSAEDGEFTLADVARGIHDKLVVRHPHVFGERVADTAEQVVRNWEQIKKEEKGRSSMMEGIPSALPSLLYAHKVQRKAASVGFDWPAVADVYPKVTEELAELQADPSEEELGDLLFAVVNVARHLGFDAESALRGATAKFRTRFMEVERLADERGLVLGEMDLAGLDGLWDEVKAHVASSSGPGPGPGSAGVSGPSASP
ncbi:MAG: tetrapyrrole methylase family protein / MazG family protein [Acidimicrobiaceae bacterium]|nr:tetrapyrrole methylase family protein / MazG family protein [Acidimicrobiaceae bacterium]